MSQARARSATPRSRHPFTHVTRAVAALRRAAATHGPPPARPPTHPHLQVLVRVRDVVVRDTLRQDLTYVSLADHCFGARASYVIFFLICFSSIGSNGAYLVFIGTVLHSLLPQLSTLAWAGVTAAAMVPVVLARKTSFLTYTSMAGNLGVLLVVVAVLVQGAAVANIGPIGSYTMFQSNTFMQAFGIVGFLYSCATNVLPIERSMTRHAGFAGAYATTTWVVFVSTTAFAIVNYLYFGSNVCSIIVRRGRASGVRLVGCGRGMHAYSRM